MQKEKRKERIQEQRNAQKSEAGPSKKTFQHRDSTQSKTIHKMHPKFR